MYSIFKAYYISHNFLQSVFLYFITELLTSSLREQSEKKKNSFNDQPFFIVASKTKYK